MAERRVVLITGASSGIGLETATLLSRRNFRVFGTRLPGQDFETRDFELLELDVTSDDSVAACVEALMAQTDRIDVLHNNAGSGLLGPVEETSLEEARAVFEVNYFGAIRMINAVLPIMRRQRSGLIVNTSSVAGNVGVPFEAHYCATKLALASLTLGLRQEVGPFGIQVVLVAPGYVRTGFYDRLRTASGRLQAYDRGRARAVTAFENSARGGNEPTAVAQVIVRAIESRSPRPRYWAGSDAALYGLFHRLLPDRLVDWVMRREFRPAPNGRDVETATVEAPDPLSEA